MKVRILTGIAGELDGQPFAWTPGDIIDIPDDLARALTTIALEDGSYRAEPATGRGRRGATTVEETIVAPEETR